MATAIRLQKYLASHGVASRRQAETLITEGLVQVNGLTVTLLGTCIDPEQDQVQVRGAALKPRQERYFLLHKPEGVVSTCADPQGRPTVLQFFPPELRRGLYPVGRLDQASTGALLLTNDGALAHRLTHPRHELWKVYQVWVRGCPTAAALTRWRQGVLLDQRLTLPASVEILDPQPTQTLLEIKLREGRNRQIRRVAQLLGYPVQSLKRVAIGPLVLGKLPVGEYRPLSAQQVGQLYALSTVASDHE